jgi:hypothetical protein
MRIEADLSKHPLDKVLQDLGVSMSFYEVRAYMLGAILGLEYVPPSHLISEILLQDTDDEVGFKNKIQAEIFFKSFTEAWNELADWPSKNAPPIFEPFSNEADQKKFLFQLFKRKAEAENVLIGFYEAETDLDTIEDPQVLFAFKWLQDYSERLDHLCEKMPKTDGHNHPLPVAEMTALFEESDRLWPTHYRTLSEGLRKQRGK